MAFIWCFLILITIASLLWAKYIQKLNYWKRYNVELISIREFGKKAKRMPWGLVINEYYQQMYAEQKPFKVMEGFLISVVIVQDLQAIKDIMITHFDNFPDRGFYVNHRDALSTNLARLDYDLWKPLRQKLSASFSPVKIKYMFPTILKVADQFVAVIGEQCDRGINQMEIYDLCARYTTDIIGNVAFGLECNSLKEPNTTFRLQGDRAFYQLLHPFLDQIAAKFPKIMQFFNVKVFDKESNEFFTRIFKENMEYRERHKIRREDFMDILIEMKNDRDTSEEEFRLTLELMVGQVFGFFVGGFETGSCTMSYALYELAKNPEIQDQVQREVLEVMAKNNRNLSYECLKDLKYLKQIIQETLRLYPIVPTMPRICRRACTLRTSSGTLTVQPDTTVIIPFYGVQHNPDYYPEPEQFRPERFSDVEMEKRAACTFLAFGAGPKVCIGELFGRLQMTLGLAMLLAQFRFSICDKTPQKLRFDPENRFLLFVKGGIQLRVDKLILK